MNKAEIKTKLEAGIATVVFTKADGSERSLKCTLQASMLPARESSEKPQRADNPEVVHVWDVDNNGWRTFRLDSMKDISFASA